MQGLYDRDHRTLRHLTADEIPRILLWVVTGTAATMLIVPELSDQPLLPGNMVEPFLIAFVAAVCFRCAARAPVAAHRAAGPHARHRRGRIGTGGAAQARALPRDPRTAGRDARAHERREIMSRWDELQALRLDRILLAAPIVEDDLITR